MNIKFFWGSSKITEWLIFGVISSKIVPVLQNYQVRYHYFENFRKLNFGIWNFWLFLEHFRKFSTDVNCRLRLPELIFGFISSQILIFHNRQHEIWQFWVIRSIWLSNRMFLVNQDLYSRVSLDFSATFLKAQCLNLRFLKKVTFKANICKISATVPKAFTFFEHFGNSHREIYFLHFVFQKLILSSVLRKFWPFFQNRYYKIWQFWGF